MISLINKKDFLQSEDWNLKFKTKTNKVIKIQDSFYAVLTKIPFTNKYFASSPKVNFDVQKVNWKTLKEDLKKENIVYLTLEYPNHLISEVNPNLIKELKKIGDIHNNSKFKKKTIFQDISDTEENLLKNMHSKKRYNIRYAAKKGIKVIETKINSETKEFKDFLNLQMHNAEKHGYTNFEKSYFIKLAESLSENTWLLNAYKEGEEEVLTSWLMHKYKDTMIYIFGGSTNKHRNLYHSDLIGFEAIKLAKKENCKFLDWWGADESKGFTDFKLKYGGEIVEYIDSYKIIVSPLYNKAVGLLKKIK